MPFLKSKVNELFLNRSIIKPTDKTRFDDKNKKILPRVITKWKYYIRAILRSGQTNAVFEDHFNAINGFY